MTFTLNPSNSNMHSLAYELNETVRLPLEMFRHELFMR